MAVSSKHAHEVTSTSLGGNGFKMGHSTSGSTAKDQFGNESDGFELSNQKAFKLRSHARASSPTGSVRSSFSSRRYGSRRLSTGFSRSQSHSYRSENTKELTSQGEREFFGLMEAMNQISRRSTSLKEVWTKLISEREAYTAEMEEMQDQFEEFAEIIERKEKENNQQNNDHEDRKQEISKLRLELTASLSSVVENRKKLHERDTELVNARHELDQFKDICARLREEEVSQQSVSDELRSRISVTEAERDDIRREMEKYATDFRSINQKHVELQSTHREMSSKQESLKAELLSLTQLNASLKKEKSDWVREKTEITESLRRSTHKSEESSHKLKDVSEKYEKKILELQRSKESVSKLGLEKDELLHKVEEFKRQLSAEHRKWEEAEDLCGKWKLKSEHADREIHSIQEEIKLHEREKSQLNEIVTKLRVEARQLTSEKKRISEDYHLESKKSDEHHRQVIVLQESVRRLEAQLKVKIEAVHSLTERGKRLEVERYEATRKSGDLSIENEQLQATITGLKSEVVALTSKHDGAVEKLRECEAKYDEVCESVTEFHEGHSEFEFEISTLRTMLREAREQKEKAVSARNHADQERDESTAKYEEKCRELERFEEEMSQQLHSQGQAASSSRRTTVMRYRRSGSNGLEDGENHAG